MPSHIVPASNLPVSSPTPLPPHKSAFLQTCLSSSALKFGDFLLKSGRRSPYFFNTSLFHTGSLLRALSTAYAQTLLAYSPALEFSVLFGPAYKGIPLATATVDKLAELDPERFGELSYSFDRKEAKDHGEGGMIVGGELKGKRVVIIDDVVTAGTAKRQAIELIRREGGTLVAIIVALDRQEKMPGGEGEDDEDGKPRESAMGQIRREYGVPVLSILTLEDLIGETKGLGREEDARACEAYWAKYRASD
ncbi:orotate phosphoribosyltransferase [Trapelia coarctata]|nr:orotate phosphoribosyltransferase [Trapelia coarctata]